MKKRILSFMLILAMAVSMVMLTACGNTPTPDTDGTPTPDAGSTPTPGADNTPDPGEEEDNLQYGVYVGSAAYSDEESDFTMNFELKLTLNEDKTFTLTNFSDESKGEGTFGFADGVYTLDFGSDKTTTFVVNEDGTIKFTSTIIYGSASIMLEMVGDVVLKYDDGKYTLAEGTYTGTFTYASMMGEFVYTYTAVVGADGTFSYYVIFTTPFDEEGDGPNEGLSLSGTYTIEDNNFVFTTTLNDEETTFTGVLTADNVLEVGLRGSDMSDRIDTVTLTA